MDRHLNVLVQSDEKYAPFAGVMLTSLFKNNQDIGQITVYLMTSDMSKKNRDRFQILAEQYHREIKFVDSKEIDSLMEAYHAPRWRGSYTAYYRLFALSIIEDEIDRLVYLDADMVVIGSLSELITCDLGDNILGMCLEIAGIHAKLIKSDSKYYYNSGMVVFDVKKWIECRGTDRVIEHMNNVHAAYPYPDQDMINLLFSKSIATMSPKYNFFPTAYAFEDPNIWKDAYGGSNYYLEKEVMSAKQSPVILHCLRVFGLRPWDEGKHPYKDVWNKYKSISPWADFIFVKYNLPFMYKMQKILYKVLPVRVYAIVNKTMYNMVNMLEAKKCGL